MRQYSIQLIRFCILIFVLSAVACTKVFWKENDRPKSIILIIADGAGTGHHSSLFYDSEEYRPAQFAHVGLLSTHPATRKRVTDSAAAATALSTGIKTDNGMLGLDPAGERLTTIVEYAIKQGMATGLVATSTITHATPAGFAAHVKSRGNYAEIARQLIKADVTVMLGGGRSHFLDTDNGGLQEEDLLAGLSRSGIQVISQIGEQVSSGGRIIGLFAPEALPRAPERKPSTSEMALKALEILEHDPDGFFLMVEESQIDWAGHANDFKYLRDEMRSLNELCGVLLAYQTQHPDVLLVLTADHETGGVSVAFNDQTNDLIPNWGTEHHSGNLVPIFATGPGSVAFDAVADITFVGQTLIEYVNRR